MLSCNGAAESLPAAGSGIVLLRVAGYTGAEAGEFSAAIDLRCWIRPYQYRRYDFLVDIVGGFRFCLRVCYACLSLCERNAEAQGTWRAEQNDEGC